MVEDYFKILGVGRDASEAEIQQAYRTLASRFHPDVHPDDPTAKKRFQEIQNAFDVLRDPEKRKTYFQRTRSERFLEILQARDLLPAELLAELQRQVSRSKKTVPAETLAKRLVEAGQLTDALAKRLLSAVPEETSVGGKAPEEEASDELQLAPLDDEPRWPAARSVTKVPPQEKGTTRAEEFVRGQPPPPPAAAPGSLFEEELAPLHPGPAGAAGTGPLDGLMGDTAFDTAAGGPLAVGPRRKGWRQLLFPRRRPGRKANVWDSPLLLVGGGVLLALVLMFVALVFVLNRQTGDEALELAERDFENGSYSQAIYKYQQYLKRFPGHRRVSFARVNCGLAQLRQVTAEGTSDWSPALQVAKDVVEEISREKEFKQGQGDLSAILMTIAQGLAAQAWEHPNPALVEQTGEALALMRKSLPESLLRPREISEIEASLALTQREILRGDKLAQAVAEMRQAVAQGNTQRAYDARKALLREYPLLADDDQLTQTMIEISRAQQKAVEFVPQQRPPETGQPTTPVLATAGLAQRTTEASPQDVAGQVVFALAGGAAYGLDAASGKPLWRRFVGFDASGQRPSFPPAPISDEPGADALLVDSARHELLRVEAASGRPLWRHAIAEPFDAHPVVAGGEVLVATRSGRLVRIDAADGSSPGYVQLPPELRVAPAVELRRSLVFQVADHSNLFVLTLPDGQCKQVMHLGHELGSITAPPSIVGRYLLIAVNDRAQDSTLRVVSIEEEGEKGPLLTPVQQVRLKGHVDVPLSVDARRGRVLVATDLGAVHLFEISGTDADHAAHGARPLRPAAEAAPASEERLVRFPLLQDDHVWVAGTELAKYYVELSRRRLELKWTGDPSSAGQQPLVAMGSTIFNVRRKLGTPGVFVSAVEMDQGRRLWETHLAAPLAAEPIVDPAGTKITAVTSACGVYQVDATELKGHTLLDQPEVAPEATRLRQPVGQVIRLADGLLVMTGGAGSDRVVVFDPLQPQERFRGLDLPDELACPPIAFAGGLLAPCKIGQVFLIDPRTGRQQTEPFQPWLEGGVQLFWRMPADAGERGAVLADGRRRLYRIQIEDQPKPHLAARARQDLAQPLDSPLAVVSDVVYAVDAAGALAVFTLPDLAPAKQQRQLLSGRRVWGPRRVGGHVMLSTDDGKLLCLDGSGGLLWQIELPYGPLAGTPLETGEHYVLAATSGVVWRLDAKSGEELGKIETGRPLGTGPVLLGDGLLVGGQDGSLYKTERP